MLLFPQGFAILDLLKLSSNGPRPGKWMGLTHELVLLDKCTKLPRELGRRGVPRSRPLSPDFKESLKGISQAVRGKIVETKK